MTSQPHALYRFYDATGTLLYVGITADPGRRWRRHARTKPWWHDVSRITIETHPDRRAVLQAERTAIVEEKPAHNIVHNRGRLQMVLPEPTETFAEFWTRDAQDMPDDCHDICGRTGIDCVYYPYLWNQGLAHYTCEHGHHWTCWWGHDKTGAAPQHHGVPAVRYTQAVAL